MKIARFPALFLLFFPLFTLGQFEHDPCAFKDTLERFALQPHNYNHPGWYEKLDSVYLEIEYERDVSLLNDTPFVEFPDIDLRIYTDYIQGDVFNGITLLRKTENGWTEFTIEVHNNLNETYRIRRPDSLQLPFLIEITYIEGNAATRASYKGVVHEIWDVSRYVRLAKYYDQFSEYYSSTSIDDTYVEGKSYSMSRTTSFDGKVLHFSATQITQMSFFQSRVEGEDQSEQVKESADSCESVSYELSAGYFVRRTD
jgi:hypothetical protein